jgi:hypothetical protein
MIALQGWWLASRRTYREGCSHVRACAGKASRQVLMHIRSPLNVTSLESDQGESDSRSQVISSAISIMLGFEDYTVSLTGCLPADLSDSSRTTQT